MIKNDERARLRSVRTTFTAPTLIGLLAIAGLVGCGDRSGGEKPATQTAVKVNKDEITVHQINFVLQQQRGLPADQAASAGRQVLEQLIDQELAVQKAQDQKLDRDPRVVQQIDAARREVIARAYVDRVSAGAPKPTPAEISAYYGAHPALFKERRVYSLQELAIQAKPDQVPGLQAKVASSKDLPEFIEYLKSSDTKFGANQEVRAAEQLPLDMVDKFAQMKDGQAVFSRTPTGARVIYVAGSRLQPVDDAQAAPAIEQFLWNERKRKVVADDVKGMRANAKIEYVGDYARGAPPKEVLPAAEAPPVTSIAPPLPAGSTSKAAPQIDIEPLNSAPASAPSLGILEKGLKGFK